MARRGANIYKRKDGRYEGRYIKEYDITGKAKYSSVYAKTYNEVKYKMDKQKTHFKVFKEITPSKISVTDWVEKWLYSIKNTVKPSTYAVYKRYLENHIKPYFKSVKLIKLSDGALQGFVDYKLNEGLAVRTVQSIFIFTKSALKEASEKQYIMLNITDNIKMPKVRQKEIHVFSLAEQKRLESVVRSSYNSNYIGVLICLYTGLRIGELCGLKWSDVDFEKSMLHIRRTMQRIENDNEQGNKTKLIFMSPKSQSSIRCIPLPAFLTELLIKHKKETGYSASYVITRDGKPIEPRSFQYQFQALLSIANIKNTNFHALRHTFATRALENGFDVKTLSEILGHASATVTLNKYAHSMNEYKRSKMESLGEVYQL